MKHNLGVRVVKDRTNGGVITCRSLTLRERLLRFLFGAPQKLTVIVPGDGVEKVTVSETGKESAYETV